VSEGPADSVVVEVDAAFSWSCGVALLVVVDVVFCFVEGFGGSVLKTSTYRRGLGVLACYEWRKRIKGAGQCLCWMKKVERTSNCHLSMFSPVSLLVMTTISLLILPPIIHLLSCDRMRFR